MSSDAAISCFTNQEQKDQEQVESKDDCESSLAGQKQKKQHKVQFVLEDLITSKGKRSIEIASACSSDRSSVRESDESHEDDDDNADWIKNGPW